MPRHPRINDPDGSLYHVTCRGNNKLPIFDDTEDRQAYTRLLADQKVRTPFGLFNYTLMPNHVHLLLKSMKGHPISIVMREINHRFSLYHKEKYGHVGHLWQGRFFSKAITTEQYLLICGLYIECNPLRAGLVDDSADYPWSSYRYYAFGEPNTLIDPNPFYKSLGRTDEERQKAYRVLMKMYGKKKLVDEADEEEKVPG